MTNIYELSEELSLSPKKLQKWLRSHGFGSSKTISHRAARAAKAHFAPPTDHPMASALEDRGGLGDVKRHEELLDQGSGIKVEERPKLKWSKVERDDSNVLQMDMNSQKDFFRNLRSTGSGKQKAPSNSSPNRSKPSDSKLREVHQQSTNTKPSSSTKKITAKAKTKPIKTLSEAQTKHSVFGSLSAMSSQLDSVTDRPKTRPSLDDQQVMNAFKQGVTPLNEQKASKKSKKRKKKTKSASTAKPSPISTQTVSIPKTSEQDQGTEQAQIKTQAELTFQDLFERPEVQSLQAKLDAVKSELKKVQEENTVLKTNINQLEQAQSLNSIAAIDSKVSQTHKAKTQTEPKLIWEHFESFGLNATQTLLALHELLDHPQRGPELVYSLKHDQVKQLTRGFALVCEEEVCREVADTYARQGLIEFSEKHLCSVCQGSDARAWYKRLLLTASNTQKTKLLVVGGDNHVHQQLKQLSRENPGLEWDFVNGANRIDQSAANAKVSHKSAVVLWSGEHLPHSLSNLFKVASDKSEVPISSLAPGQRSVAAVCMSILKSWHVPIAISPIY